MERKNTEIPSEIVSTARKTSYYTDYEAFVDKFKTKLTTDDCFTPPAVFDAILQWGKERYGISDSTRIVRPFWPGADFTKEDYSGDCIVWENPPFSIVTGLVKWYTERKIRFFLFCPYLTSLRISQYASLLVTARDIVYENGATIPTSFATNLEDPSVAIKSVPELSEVIRIANKTPDKRKPVRNYPDEVVLESNFGYLCQHGIDLTLRREDIVCRVSALDEQRPAKKQCFGSAYLTTHRFGAERAALERTERERAERERWRLSPRELELIHNHESNMNE